MFTLKTTPTKTDFFLPLCGPELKVSVELPDLSVERSPREKIKNLSNFGSRKFFTTIASAITNQQIEEAIVQEEQRVMESYRSADVAIWVVVRQVEETEKAVKVMAKVVRGGSEPRPGTSQFWVPKNIFFLHDGKPIVPKDFVARKLEEFQKKPGGFRKKLPALARPVDVICLPEIDWTTFFANLRAKIPADVAERVAARKEEGLKLEAKRLEREEERQRSLPARIEAARLAEIKSTENQVKREATENARVAALETVAENVTVHGHDWAGTARSPKRENWTFENVSVKKSGTRAYIVDAAGTVLRKKPMQNITIVPKAGPTNTS